MNNDPERTGLVTVLAAFGLSSLPPQLYALAIKALEKGATMAQVHEAAHAIADEAPVTCLEGVIATLIFLANPDVDLTSVRLSTALAVSQAGG